jgi:hypothetical protein
MSSIQRLLGVLSRSATETQILVGVSGLPDFTKAMKAVTAYPKIQFRFSTATHAKYWIIESQNSTFAGAIGSANLTDSPAFNVGHRLPGYIAQQLFREHKWQWRNAYEWKEIKEKLDAGLDHLKNGTIFVPNQ